MTNYFKKLGFFKPSFFFIFCGFYSHGALVEGSGFYPEVSKKTSNNRSLNYISNYKKVSKNLENNLFHIMRGLVEAHQSLKEKNMSLFRSRVESMIQQIDQINLSQESRLNYHQRLYLSRQLQEVRENMRFILLEGVSSKDQMNSLKVAYKEFIQLSQIYTINHDSKQYGVYFCSRNSSVWVQNTNTKVYNPFHKDYRNCGRKIR